LRANTTNTYPLETEFKFIIYILTKW